MNIPSLSFNGNLYRKLSLALAIIRSVPSSSTPKEFTKQLQFDFRRERHEKFVELEKLRSTQIRRSPLPRRSIELIENYNEFLRKFSTNSSEFSMEMQMIVNETIERLFELMEENFSRLVEEKISLLFKQSINLIFIYDPMTNIREHCLSHLGHFLERLFIGLKQLAMIEQMKNLIEQIGFYPGYFLFTIEKILCQLMEFFLNDLSTISYGENLLHLLEKFLSINDRSMIEQILSNDSVRCQFHSLLYLSLVGQQSKLSLTIRLWNLYGRLIDE